MKVKTKIQKSFITSIQLATCAFCALCAVPTGGIASEHPTHSGMLDTSIAGHIKAYLASHSLAPVFTKEAVEYDIQGIDEDLDEKIAYVHTTLRQGENEVSALFSVKKGLFWNETELLYLTTDEFIPYTLYKSVLDEAAQFLAKKPTHYYVFIEKGVHDQEGIIQHWTFFNPEDRVSLHVVMTECDHGGMDFSIMDMPG